MKKIASACLIGITYLVVPQTALATTYTCMADPKAYLAIGGDGLVYTAVSNGSGNAITAICSLGVQHGSINPQACMAWYSALLTGRTTGAKALPHFDTAEPTNSATTGCSSLASWQEHLAYFLLIQ